MLAPGSFESGVASSWRSRAYRYSSDSFTGGGLVGSGSTAVRSSASRHAVPAKPVQLLAVPWFCTGDMIDRRSVSGGGAGAAQVSGKAKLRGSGALSKRTPNPIPGGVAATILASFRVRLLHASPGTDVLSGG